MHTYIHREGLFSENWACRAPPISEGGPVCNGDINISVMYGNTESPKYPGAFRDNRTVIVYSVGSHPYNEVRVRLCVCVCLWVCVCVTNVCIDL